MNNEEIASRGARLGAHLAELALVFPFGLIGGVLGYQLGRAHNLAQPVAPSLIFALALTAVSTFALAVVQIYWLSTRGQTLGKRWMKIRIVCLDGTNPGFVRAVLLRGFVGGAIYLILALVGGPGLGYAYLLVDLLLIFGAQSRCLHDRIAGTKVVRVVDPGASFVDGPAVA